MLKKICCITVVIFTLINILSVNVSAFDGEGWYVKRNGNKRPIAPVDDTFLQKYDAYYIDKKLTDESEKKTIYLTFDAGYENGNVEKVLNILKENNVPSAFFILDRMVLKHSDLLLRMVSEGHTVCNHTKNHKNVAAMTAEEIKNNLYDLDRIYEEKTGNKMSPFFRFPEGRYSEEAIKTVKELGYKTVFWSLAYADWDNQKQPDAEKSKKLLLDNTHNGAVILLHPTSDTNVRILDSLIKEWKARGYSFGTLDELVK